MSVLILASEYNKVITDSLVNIAEERLQKLSVDFETKRIPGAFELPAALSFLHNQVLQIMMDMCFWAVL